MIRKPPKGDPGQLRKHYEIEKELANRLPAASKKERQTLYSPLYGELFQRVPYHSQLTRKKSSQGKQQAVDKQIRYLKPLLYKDSTFLEIGPEDCALSIEASKYASQVLLQKLLSIRENTPRYR